MAESFFKWKYLKIVLVVLFGITVAQGALWYTVFFYAQFFIEKVLKMDGASVNLLMLAITVVSAPLYVLFGALSDRFGRKPVMLFGIVLTMLALMPGFHLIARAANPALADATARTPVTVIADPAECSVQFDPVGKAAFLSSCDIAKSTLAGAGVSYANRAAPSGAPATVQVGGVTVASKSAVGLPAEQQKAVKAEVVKAIAAALKAGGYPAAADPDQVNWPLLFGVMLVFAVGATALYGPMASALVELFPTRIRYTAMSLPYNIGTGWIGGFLPAVSFAIVAINGNMYFGLWYPIACAALSAVVMALCLRETRGRDLYVEV
jgi:MFS family permease